MEHDKANNVYIFTDEEAKKINEAFETLIEFFFKQTRVPSIQYQNNKACNVYVSFEAKRQDYN